MGVLFLFPGWETGLIVCLDTIYLYHIGVLEIASFKGGHGQGSASERAWPALWALISFPLEASTLDLLSCQPGFSLVNSRRQPSLPNPPVLTRRQQRARALLVLSEVCASGSGVRGTREGNSCYPRAVAEFKEASQTDGRTDGQM